MFGDDKDGSTDGECDGPMIGLVLLNIWYVMGGALMGAMAVYWRYMMRSH